CIHWLELAPGLVCLHDFFLGNLFNGWAQISRESADQVLLDWYGEHEANRYFSFSDVESFIEGTRHTTPMTEWICSQALAVIAHSHWGCDRVVASCPGPVRVVPLAYDLPLGETICGDEKTHRTAGLQLLTVGHINRNKRVESIIE